MSKLTIGILTAVLAVTMLAAPAPQSYDKSEAAFKAAYEKEMVDGDLRNAIAQYEKLARGSNRPVAAKALVRIGQCHEKLGSSDARKAYERVVREFADQSETVADARARLAAMRGHVPQAPNSRLAWTMSYSYNLGNVSPDGRYHAYISGPEGGITLRDLQSGETRLIPGAMKNENPYEAVVSHDGKWIAYGGQPNWGLQELRVIAVDGGAPRTVFKTGKETNVSWVMPQGWSPDGKEVLVVFNRPDTGYHVGMMSVQNGAVRVLKEFEYGFYRWASLSPDGKWVAYNVQTSPDSIECDIHVVRSDGSGERKLIDHPADDIDPHWTADGRGLVWRSNRRGSIDAFFVHVKDGQVTGNPTLVKTDVRDELKGVSHSGTLFYQAQTGTEDLHLLELDNQTGAVRGAPRKLNLAYSGPKRSAAISPDGEWLAYVRPSLSTPRVNYIVLRSLRSGQEREIHPKVKNLVSIAWSPDGMSFALLARNMRDVHTLYLMDLATASLRAIVDKQVERKVNPGFNVGFRAASFSPDGRTFYPPPAFEIENSAIVAVETASLQSRVLYRKPGQRYRRPWVSPDGHLIAAVYNDPGGKKNGLVVIDAQTGEIRSKTQTTGGIQFNGWTPDSKHVVLYAAPALPANPADETPVKADVWRVSVDGGAIVKSPLPAPFTFRYEPAPQGNGNFLLQPSGAFAHEIWAVNYSLPKD